MILKVIGSIMILLSGTTVGLLFSRKCSERLKQLRQLQMLFNILESQIGYLTNLITDAFDAVCKAGSEPVLLFFQDTVNYLKNDTLLTARCAWELAVDKNIKATSLNDEDKEVLISFGKTLGNCDLKRQLKDIEFTVKRIREQEKKAQEYKNKNEYMYRKLGLLAALALVIVLI